MCEIRQCTTLPETIRQCITLPHTTRQCNTMPKIARQCTTMPEMSTGFLHTLSEIVFKPFEWNCLQVESDTGARVDPIPAPRCRSSYPTPPHPRDVGPHSHPIPEMFGPIPTPSPQQTFPSPFRPREIRHDKYKTFKIVYTSIIIISN